MKLFSLRACWLLTITVLLCLVGCGDKEPIKVGFSGPLTGTLSDYGLSCRRGVILAVEAWNKAGGIDGRQVALLIKDDKNDPEEAVRVDLELMNEGVVAIIGHFTSTASMAAAPVMEKKGILLISPGATTSKLSQKDDLFLRTIEADDEKARGQAQYAFQTLGFSKAALVYDTANRAYAEPYIGTIKETFIQLGGEITIEISFDSKTGIEAGKINDLAASDSEIVFLVTGAVDAAQIAQELFKQGRNMQLFSSAWAMRKEFIENGGKPAEGTLIAGTLDINADSPRLLAFKKRFKERFNEPADTASARGYDAAIALKAGLEKASSLTGPSIKQAILETGIIPALNGDFPMDKYGDAKRPFLIFKVEQGEFKPQS